jgi:hypothetical protein
MDDAIHLPIGVQFKSKSRAGRRVELAMPDPHQHRGVGLKAAMVDPDGHFDVRRFGPFVFIPDGASLDYFDGKGAVKLDIGDTDNRIADLDIVVKLEVAAFLSEASKGPPIP